jgi:hypothetical protein
MLDGESGIFALSLSFGIRVLPCLNQARLDGVALELSGKTDTISTPRQAMRPADAAAKVTPLVARLRCAFLCEIFFETSDVGDELDLGCDAEPRSAQYVRDVAICR